LYSNDRKFIYEGDWVEDEKEGFGKEIFPDGTGFEGEFEKGKKNGIGNFKQINLRFLLILIYLFFVKKIIKENIFSQMDLNTMEV